jgi:rare lipoprotein A
MDGSITMRLRVGLTAAVVLGLGGTLAPGYAKETAPLPAAVAVTGPIAASADSPASPDVANDGGDQDSSWHSIGGGMASWYGNELAGHRTASGERFDPNELTAAHRTLPIGSEVRVTYHGRSVIVRINDRGPFAGHRVIDLSRAAAEEIGLRRAGAGRVTLSMLDDEDDVGADQAGNGDVQVADASDQ